MKKLQRTGERTATGLGIGMIFLWTLVLGPIGGLLLGGLTYSMLSNNLTVGIACGLILFSPLLITLVWAPLMWRTCSPKESPDHPGHRVQTFSWSEGSPQ
jgi:hypothetical protein